MIKIFASKEELYRGVADLVTVNAQRAAAKRGHFSALLSGGETPRGVYELLAREPYHQRIPWQDTHLFWGDERCVPPNDPRSNALMARRAFLDHVPVPHDQAHPINCAQDPETAARTYEHLLKAHFGNAPPCFDLILLGLGTDGHTASLFPGAKALGEQMRWVVPVQRQGDPVPRITLTFPVLNRGRLIIVLVSGSDKAPILRVALNPPVFPERLPIHQVRPVEGTMVWCADTAAASLLDKRRPCD